MSKVREVAVPLKERSLLKKLKFRPNPALVLGAAVVVEETQECATISRKVHVTVVRTADFLMEKKKHRSMTPAATQAVVDEAADVDVVVVVAAVAVAVVVCASIFSKELVNATIADSVTENPKMTLSVVATVVTAPQNLPEFAMISRKVNANAEILVAFNTLKKLSVVVTKKASFPIAEAGVAVVDVDAAEVADVVAVEVACVSTSKKELANVAMSADSLTKNLPMVVLNALLVAPVTISRLVTALVTTVVLLTLKLKLAKTLLKMTVSPQQEAVVVAVVAVVAVAVVAVVVVAVAALALTFKKACAIVVRAADSHMRPLHRYQFKVGCELYM